MMTVNAQERNRERERERERMFCQMKREDNIAPAQGVLEKVITVHHEANEGVFKWR